MSMIDIEALEALVDAVTRSHDDVNPQEFVQIVRKLDDRGWQLTRVPAEPVLPECFVAPTPPRVWPPLGVKLKLWVELNPGGFELIEDWTGLRFAKVAGIPIVEAGSEVDAKAVLSGPHTRDHFTYGAEEFQYCTDEIPF